MTLRVLIAAALAALLLSAGAWFLVERQSERDTNVPVRLLLPVNAAELDQAGLERTLDLARTAGVTEIETGAVWWYVTRGGAPDDYDWTALDRLAEAAARRQMQVHVQLSGTPDAVHPEIAETVADSDERVWNPPRTPEQLRQWGRFVADTVAHFQGRAASFEIWNEPNLDTFWRPAPAPAEYAQLLAESYRSAKRAWPDATIVFGGLSENDAGFLERYYAEARRLFPDAAAQRYFFDVLNVHPYTDGRSPDQTSPDAVIDGAFGLVDKNFSGLARMKATMDRNEAGAAAGGKPIMLGEYGFSTTGDPSAPAVPDRRRAYFLKRAVALASEMPFVYGLSWYGFLPDSATPPQWAITTADGRGGWTYQALVDLAHGGGPTVRLPEQSQLRPGDAPIRPVLDGLDADDIEHTELYVDGVLHAEAAGPQLRWRPSHPGHAAAAGKAQLVVYTHDRHAWPSNIVDVGA
jgi:hypothetical protein